MFGTTASIPVYDWAKPNMGYSRMELLGLAIPVIGMTGMIMTSRLVVGPFTDVGS